MEQAGLLPNPELSLQGEDLAASGPSNVAAEPQSTVWLSQVLELGGKRMSRVRAAERERDLSLLDFEVQRIAVSTEVARAFIDVLGAQERRDLAEEMTQIAERTTAAIGERVDAGAAAAVERTRSSVTLANARIELERAAGDLETARIRLASTWGDAGATFGRVIGKLTPTQSIPSLADLMARLARNPDLARWSAAVAASHARLDLEEARSVPDVTLSAGYRRFYDTDNNALVAGIAVPIPIFDRNQGRIAEARSRIGQAEESHEAARVQLESDLRRSYVELATAHREVFAFDREIVPSAERSFSAVEEGYLLGKLGLLDLLDTQRMLFVTRGDRVNALVRFHQAVAGFERLLGEPLGNGAIGYGADATLRVEERP